NPEDRKDIIQEIIIQIWKSFEKYSPNYKYSTWIYKIALNVAISHYRKEKKRNAFFTNINGDFINISENHSEEDDLEENLEVLQTFISELDKLNKALILLYLESYSYKEISEVLGISETNVATKINRIKKRLKAQFENQVIIKS
ncbi:MAG: RNA polymerase sigma factor, partial [Cyclobacteriaceae bacterium]|nr:RNA polymerase sigma factor [Cyclobacteriaceae bacterium]